MHILAPDGSVLNPLRDTYDHAFVLLAMTTVYQLDRDARVRAEIDELMQFIDTQLRSPDGGYLEGVPASMPRRQNPQCICWRPSSPPLTQPMTRHSRRVPAICSVYHVESVRCKEGRARRIFRTGLVADRAGQRRAGHQAEWVWLLKGFERITVCPTGKQRAAFARIRAALSGRHRLSGGRRRRPGQYRQGHTALLAAGRDRPRPSSRRRRQVVEGAADEARAALVSAGQILSAHPSKAAGTINSTVRDARWWMRSRRHPSIIFYARSLKPNGCSAPDACAI